MRRCQVRADAPSDLMDDHDQTAQNGGAGGREEAGFDAAEQGRHLYTV